MHITGQDNTSNCRTRAVKVRKVPFRYVRSAYCKHRDESLSHSSMVAHEFGHANIVIIVAINRRFCGCPLFHYVKHKTLETYPTTPALAELAFCNGPCSHGSTASCHPTHSASLPCEMRPAFGSCTYKF